jgi:hypothetical protein
MSSSGSFDCVAVSNLAQDDNGLVVFLRKNKQRRTTTADPCGMTTKKQRQQQLKQQIPFGDDNQKGKNNCHSKAKCGGLSTTSRDKASRLRSR